MDRTHVEKYTRRGCDRRFYQSNYIESYACFLELLTAVNNKKPIVFVSLEEQLHLGDTTDLPNVERGVKKEILNQGSNIATNTNNNSNDIMRAMKSAYTSLSTLLEQDALSKYDISDAFINFFRDASVNRKTINDMRAVKNTIESISRYVFESESVPDPIPVPVPNPPDLRLIKKDASAEETPVKKGKEEIDKPVFKFKMAAIAGCLGLAILVIIAVTLSGGTTEYVTNNEYTTIDSLTGKYTGEWKNDKPKGEGTIIYDDGSFYEGEWKDGEKNGQGTMTWAEGSVYVGEWKNGQINGQGTTTFSDGRVYKGSFVNGQWNGYGTLKETNGDVYAGEWKNGKQNGQGTITYANGNVYKGSFVNGKQEGRGSMTFHNGSVYEGSFVNGKRDDQGTLTWASGDVYEGEWKNGKQNGQGTMTWASRDVYEGEWKNGKQNGQGTMTWASGNVYKGEWKNGNRDGQGTLTHKNGSVYKQEWKDNEMISEQQIKQGG